MQNIAAKYFRFADFELDGAKRLLRKQGKPVALNSKSFDLLLTLVEHHGEILTRDDLLEKVWSGQFVEEGNLTVQVSALRKIFGERKDDHRFIVTVPGKGYSFVAELDEPTESDIIVESHSLSRIIVEEEISDEPNRAIPLAASNELTRASQTNESRTRLFLQNRVVVAGVVLLIAAIGMGGFLWQRQNRAAIPFKETSIKRLTTSGNVTNARISPDGKLYAYVTFADGLRTLWLGHVDGGEPKQLLPPTQTRYVSIKFSADSSSLYFATISIDGPLYRMPVFGGVPEKLRENVRGSFNVSPDSKRIAFIRSNKKNSDGALFVSDIDGKNEREIAKPSTDGGFATHNPAWSPDGETIAVGAANDDKSTSFDLYLVNSADGAVKRLSEQNWSEVGATAWLSDGSGLVVVATERNGIRLQVWHVSYPGGEVQRLLTDLNIYGTTVSLSSDDRSMLLLQRQPQSSISEASSADLLSARPVTPGSIGRIDGWDGLDWAPDGRIIYTAAADNSITIRSMNFDGSDPKQLIPNGGINESPRVTSDGRYLVFQSNRGGYSAIWRADLSGTELRQLTGDTTAGQPALTPDGRSIIYVSERNAPGVLWRIPIDGGDPVQLTRRKVHWPSVSPDGKFIACGIFNDGKKLAVFSIDGGDALKVFDVPPNAEFEHGILWSPDGNSIAYLDWVNGIWKQALDGGEPQRLEGLPKARIYSFGWSRDGSRFAFTQGTQNSDAVLIRNKK